MGTTVGSVATLSDGGLPDGGERESPVDPTPRTKGGSPHRDPGVWENGDTDLLGIAKTPRTHIMYIRVYVCMCESVGEFGSVRSTDLIDTPRRGPNIES